MPEPLFIGFENSLSQFDDWMITKAKVSEQKREQGIGRQARRGFLHDSYAFPLGVEVMRLSNPSYVYKWCQKSL